MCNIRWNIWTSTLCTVKLIVYCVSPLDTIIIVMVVLFLHFRSYFYFQVSADFSSSFFRGSDFTVWSETLSSTDVSWYNDLWEANVTISRHSWRASPQSVSRLEDRPVVESVKSYVNLELRSVTHPCTALMHYLPNVNVFSPEFPPLMFSWFNPACPFLLFWGSIMRGFHIYLIHLWNILRRR